MNYEFFPADRTTLYSSCVCVSLRDESGVMWTEEDNNGTCNPVIFTHPAAASTLRQTHTLSLREWGLIKHTHTHSQRFRERFNQVMSCNQAPAPVNHTEVSSLTYRLKTSSPRLNRFLHVWVCVFVCEFDQTYFSYKLFLLLSHNLINYLSRLVNEMWFLPREKFENH